MEGSKAYGRNHKFLLTHPVWDVTIVIIVYNKIKSFLLTHPVWDVTEHSATVTGLKGISTHTSRVGCDWSLLPASLHHCISTHTSRVGCDVIQLPHFTAVSVFLLTHPVWDVTLITEPLY